MLLFFPASESSYTSAPQGLIPNTLDMLDAWLATYTAAAKSLPATADPKETAASLQVPVWVEAALLMLDLASNTVIRKPKSDAAPVAGAAGTSAAAPGTSSAAAPDATAATAAAAGTSAEGAAPAAGAPAAAGTSAPSASDAAAAAATPAPDAAAAAPATTAPATAGPSTATAAKEKEKEEDKLAAALQAALAETHKNWRPCGMLDEAEQKRALSVVVNVLRSLHTYADKWAPSVAAMLETSKDASAAPSPTSVTQACLALLARLTKAHDNAQAALGLGVHKLLLSLPSACLAPSFAAVEGHVLSVLRHMAEDAATLGAWMESEIRQFFASRGK